VGPPEPFKRGAHLTSLKTVNDTIVRKTGMRPWTPHDLRRTAASKMRAIGTDRRVLQALLNHKDRSVTAVYDRYAMDREKQEAVAAWGRRVEQIVGGGDQGAVVPFPGRHLSPRGGEPALAKDAQTT
jgi:integrase